MTHQEPHKIHHTGWLRAAVLGANDGIISTSSLILGVAASSAGKETVLLAGIASLFAGAISMAAGEYVSVSSQADAEKADLAIEAKSLQEHPVSEEAELARIYEARGLTPSLAQAVAAQLMQHDALGAHARDDIGILEHSKAKPLQAACFSAVTFVLGAIFPLLTAWFMPFSQLSLAVAVFSLGFLALLGGLAAYTGGASVIKGAGRVMLWGALAMSLTALIGTVYTL